MSTRQAEQAADTGNSRGLYSMCSSGFLTIHEVYADERRVYQFSRGSLVLTDAFLFRSAWTANETHNRSINLHVLSGSPAKPRLSVFPLAGMAKIRSSLRNADNAPGTTRTRAIPAG
jgi:hypothetical protein